MMTNSMLFEFFLGLLIGYFYEQNYLVKKHTFVFLVFSILLLCVNVFFSFDHNYRLIFYGIPSAILIFSILSFEYIRTIKYNSLLVYLGTLSYSLYLSHVFSYKLFLSIIPESFISTNSDLIIVLTILFTIIFSSLIYYVIEKPFEDFSKKLRIKYKF